MTSATATRPGRISAAEARRLVPDEPLMASVGALESLDNETLYRHTRAAIAQAGHFTAELAKSLDDVLMLKFVQLISSEHATNEHFHGLETLIGVLCSDDVREQLDQMPERFAARWQALSDAMVVKEKVLEANAHAAARAEVHRPSWESVAQVLLAPGDHRERGVPTNRLAEALSKVRGSPLTKGAVSIALNAMEAKGWVEAVATGRTKVYFAGRKIADSQAWKDAELKKLLPPIQAGIGSIEMAESSKSHLSIPFAKKVDARALERARMAEPARIQKATGEVTNVNASLFVAQPEPKIKAAKSYAVQHRSPKR